MATIKTPSTLAAVQSNGEENKGQSWHQLCESLLKERDQLLARVAGLRSENRQLKQALGHLMFEDIPFNEEELLADAGAQPSFKDLISELENEEALS